MLRGLNYDVAANLNKAMRLIKIDGCNGSLKISTDSNDRIFETYQVN